MAHDMLSELRQTRPFAIPEEELYLSLIRTADILGRACHDLLKDARLSPPQYNVLRILRGAGDPGLPCGEIAARMVTRDPDVTRLLDRLEQRGLITRGRGMEDRRVVSARITASALDVLSGIDPLMQDLHRHQLGTLSAEERTTLLTQLMRIREALDADTQPGQSGQPGKPAADAKA